VAQKFTVPITVKQLTSAGSDAVTVYVDADTYARLKIEAGGRLVWGDGSGSGDVTLYRDSANVLKTDDTFKAPTLYVDDVEIDTTSASVGNVLKFDGTKFSPGVASTVGLIDDLSDVVITSPEEFQNLYYDGTNWVNNYSPVVSYVRNAETTTITTGTVVYLFGGNGDHASVKRADNNSDTTSSKTIGVAGANIAASQNGPIITRGYVDGINLSTGYSVGDVLWLGENGAFTTTKPSAPDHLVFVGVVVRATNNGLIYVATQNGYELGEIHDVKTNGKADKDVLMWSSASAVWVNDQINLGTDTVGNYMSGVSASTGIYIAHTPSEGSTATISLNATLDDLSNVSVASPTLNDVLTYNGSSWVSQAGGGSGYIDGGQANTIFDTTNIDGGNANGI